MIVHLNDWLQRRKYIGVTLSVAIIVVAELLLKFAHVDVALWIYLVELLVLVAAVSLTQDDGSVLASLALLPLFRLVNLAMPAFAGTPLYRYLVVYGAVLSGVFVVHRSVGSADGHGRGLQFKLLGFAFVLGAVLGAVEHVFAPRAALLSGSDLPQVLLFVIVMFGTVALVEELLFRGVIQRMLQFRLGRHSGIALASLVFGVMYAVPGSGASLVFGIVLGTLLGYLYDETRSLLLVWLVRGTLNVVLYGIMPVVTTVR